MTCRVSLSSYARRRLWSESAGFCHNPACQNYLFADEAETDFAEMAHVIPASPGGPRDVPVDQVSLTDRADHQNIVVLCANCHTMVDKTPDKHPADMMFAWKKHHVDQIQAIFGAPRFASRAEARQHIEPLMEANHTVHTRYGPTGDPYVTGNPELWQVHARSTIIPNNRKIQGILKANRHLLTQSEKRTAALFDLHVEQFENRHVLGDWTAGTERYPAAMQTMLEDSPETREQASDE